MSVIADLVAGLFGARGSGKSYTVRQFLADPAHDRVLMFDPINQDYRDLTVQVPTLAAMGAASKAAKFRLRYVPVLEDDKPKDRAERFSAFCALAAVRGNLVVVVEEAHLFTSANGGSKEWSALTLMGRHERIRIFCLSQRPAHIDKDLFSNATFLRSGRLNFADDVTTMANALRVPKAAVLGLLGHEWIGRDLLTGDLSCEPADAVERSSRPASPPPPAPAQPPAPPKPARARRKSAKRKKK